MKLKNTVSIVTGGANGIGKNLASKLARKGSIVGIIDIDKKALGKLSKTNSRLVPIHCDVTDYQNISLVIDRFYKKYKKIDILINNAGIISNSALISFSEGKLKKHDVLLWNKVVSTNLNSVFYITSHVVEKMVLTRTKGIIINISSISASGNAGQGAYSASKAGVNALTKTWSKELGLLGIRVVSIAPGFTDTEATRKALTENYLNEWKRKTPLRRLGKPDEISDAAIAVINNDFINGKVIEIDGGLVI